MPTINAYAAMKPKDKLQPYTIERRKPGAHDVVIAIEYCGICHSDVHQVNADWGANLFPMVPGHEIAGTVIDVGDAVTRYKIGDKAGVGCMVDSCGECGPCLKGLEQHCEKGVALTYNSKDKKGQNTYGGYSTQIVVDEKFVLKIPDNLPLDKAAPLLCAGITTYSPLKRFNIKTGSKVGVIGLGGLGHMAVKLAAAMGAEVTVFSTSENKKADAKKLGATHFINTKNKDAFNDYQKYFDFIINTVSANIDLSPYLSTLKLNATLVLVGAPETPLPVNVFSLLMNRNAIAGSMIGGIQETQEMLDFCGAHNITADIELISAKEINDAYQRMQKGDVHYRFVIDTNTIK